MALPKRYVTCPKCGKTLEQNKSNFTWFAYPKDNKRCHEICKNCEETQLYRENWKDGLLKCHICGKYFPEEVFHKKGGTKIRNNRDTRCPKCKAEQNKAKRKEYSNEEKLNAILLSRFHGAKDRALKLLILLWMIYD